MNQVSDWLNVAVSCETVAEFKRWADEQDCTLRPAFEWRSATSADETAEQHEQIVALLITLAVYTEEGLQAVYPHVDGNNARTIYDGIEALRSLGSDAEQSADEKSERVAVPLQ